MDWFSICSLFTMVICSFIFSYFHSHFFLYFHMFRMTLDDPYFLTEGLYAPESELTDTKQVTLHVVTITPSSWTSVTDPSSCPTQDSLDIAQSGMSQCADSQQLTVFNGTSRESCASGPLKTSDISGVISADSEPKKTLTFKHPVQEVSADEAENPHKPKVRKIDEEECLSDGVTNAANMPQHTKDKKQTETALAAAGADSQSGSKGSWISYMHERLQGRPYILDIDLDFFSTKDPFQNDCTPEQMKLLKQVFEFTLPSDRSEKVKTLSVWQIIAVEMYFVTGNSTCDRLFSESV